MTDIQRGYRCKLEETFNIQNDITITINVNGSGDYDSCCFGVDSNDKLSDESYMVFFNQVASPNREIILNGSGASTSYTVNFAKLPSKIQKLVFTLSINDNTVMRHISNLAVEISQNGKTLSLKLKGVDFQNEKAVIAIEIYRKDVWRLSAVASGFNGGLSALLKHYGGEEAAPSEKPVTPTYSKVSLKKGEKVSLTKSDDNTILVENGWTAPNKDYDLKALVRYRNGKLIYIGAANSDELIATPEGAVKHSGDSRTPGQLESIRIIWHSDIASIAVSSYSALENGTGSFREYGVFVRIKSQYNEVSIAAADASANETSYTLCFGEILFGDKKGEFDIVNLEMYSAPGSENRLGYHGSKVIMDIGPMGQTK